MSYILNHDGKPYLKFFEDIAAIPHGSFNEAAIAQYVCDFAEKHNLKYQIDDMKNIVIWKPATPGYEDHPPVSLQGHMDMVCEKAPGVEHDFEKDPLKLRVVDGFLMATDTTLGADDGVAVALMMALLESDDYQHPELECIFTVSEEPGVIGASAFDCSILKAKKMIGLDGLTEGTSTVLTSGVIHGDFKFPAEWEAAAGTAFELKIFGLNGGHGGNNMIKEQANAIKMMARALSYMKDQFPVKIADFKGGTIRNGIAEECNACIVVDEKNGAAAKDIFLGVINDVKKEHAVSDPGIDASFAPCDLPEKVLTEKVGYGIVDFLFLLPTGAFMRSLKYKDLPIASRNLGNISVGEAEIIVGYMHRNTHTSMLNDFLKYSEQLCGIYGGTFEAAAKYPGYEIEPGSPLYQIWNDVYKKYSGKDIEPEAVHYGTDTGTFVERIEGLDVIVMSPIIMDPHRPTERLDLASFDRTYQYLKDILEKC